MPTLDVTFRALRTSALKYPETREDQPWGESAIKVRGKTFLFMRCENGQLGLSVKLTEHHEFALEYPFASPSGHGLGKSGWVSCKFAGKDKPPMDVLSAWIDESYRAVAPQRLVATLGRK